MEDLSQFFGAKVEVAENKLVYGNEDFSTAQNWTKTFADGKYAYKNPESELDILYYGARYMEKTKDEDVFIKHGMMFDLTILNKGKVGDEFVKTVGHYHGHTAGVGLSYPEVYEVLSGKIEYLLQSEPDEKGEFAVIWVVAEPGDKVIMPPNWGHVSMNTGAKLGVETDLQVRDNPNDSDYSVFKERTGGAYYRSENKHWPNPNYKISSFKRVRPKEKPEWGLTKTKTLYQSFIENPEKFDWLKNPKNYDFSDLWESADKI